MPLRCHHKIILPLHALHARLVEPHIELPENVRKVQVQLRVREINPDAGPGPAREGDQLILQLDAFRAEPAFRTEGLGVREVGRVHVVAVRDTRDGSLGRCQKKKGVLEETAIRTPAGM